MYYLCRSYKTDRSSGTRRALSSGYGVAQGGPTTAPVARPVLQPSPSRSLRSGVNRRGQHRFKLTVGAANESKCLGNYTRTNRSSWVTRQQIDEGTLLAGTSFPMSTWEEERRKRVFKVQCRSSVSVVFQQCFWVASV